MKDSKEVIVECINFIEKNIYSKITLDDLSHHIGISKYYLHRLFKSLTGESVMEYVQARKLTSSISELVNTKKRIIDIALDYGFDFEQSYIRAFRKKFGYTPLKTRTDQTSIILKEKINVNEIISVGNTIVYKPFFVFRQKFDIVGMKYKIHSKSGDKNNNTYGCDFFYNHSSRIKNAVNPLIYFGYTNWNENNEDSSYYMPSLQVPNLKDISAGMSGVSIPANKYVVFKFAGFFRPEEVSGRQIGRILVHLYSKWIFNSNFEFADSYRFEYIDTSMSKENYCELDIYQPIKDQNSIFN